ncbi:4Fe-4S dicluster domain-containing protein [Proteobacteria bacterium 005FR1]|nr:4Fe-4S dicluster domain-containing protein [Proteobacteria bacterium 005FR1]
MTDRKPSPSARIPAVNVDDDSNVQLWQPSESKDSPDLPPHIDVPLGRQQLERYLPILNASSDRRRFLKMMAASMGAAGLGPGLTACVKGPAEEIVPYVDAPEIIVPGKARYYSSVFTRNGYGYGVVAESHQGRPTKIEGNPMHPASLGASDVFMQAELLNLYDPDRSRAVQENGEIRSQGNLRLALANKREQWSSSRGRGLRILTPLVTSPSLASQIRELLRVYPEARWHQWQPINDDKALQGARLAFGRDLAVDYRLAQADVVLQLDGDLLSELPGSLHYARDFARRREPLGNMSRVYAVESQPGLIGAMADHRLGANALLIEQLARHLSAQLTGRPVDPSETSALSDEQQRWLQRCARDLREHAGRSLVIAGAQQSPSVHALAHWINDYLGNAGTTVIYREPVAQRSELLTESLQDLSRDIATGEVDSLLMIDCNPVFDAPADFEFGQHLKAVPFTAHIGLYFDETAALSRWHIPLSHALESWGDARAFEGTIAIQQPLISPLYDTVSPYSLLAFLSGDIWRSDYDCVRRYWADVFSGGDSEQRWRRMLIRGVLEDSASALLAPSLQKDAIAALNFEPQPEGGLLLQFAPDPRLWDGRYANNAWLQELPQPLTKTTWGNALLMSPALAAAHDLSPGDLVQIDFGDAGLEAPVWPMPGHPDDAVSITLGYGRNIKPTQAPADEDGAIGNAVGADAYPLRMSDNLALRAGATLRKTGRSVALARSQHQSTPEGREPVREATLDFFRDNPAFIASDESAHNPEKSLYPEPTPEPFATAGYEWGMSVDLNACIGCGACSLACQAENNIPVVGREQVLEGRLMHWLRIDRYYSSGSSSSSSSESFSDSNNALVSRDADVQTHFQPMLCQHCENAPCEYVCPVGATVHDSEGLNVMVYNRCIGTRDCSQNCPYKVRRFNFLEYNYDQPRTDAMAPARNPDVTVRSRGVMEKCTYCLQRISETRREAKKEGRPIRDGEVLTACQQSCPTQAIVFGDVSDPDTRVSKAKRHPLSYSVLAPLNTRPRTTYVARIRNPGFERRPVRNEESE